MFCTVRIKKFSLVAAVIVLIGAVFLISQAGRTTPVDAKVQEGVQLPAIMYHSMLKESARQGKYVVSPDLFENDLKYLKEHGYTAIGMQELIDYVQKGTALPEKPILLTFDDGYYNNYLYAFPLAKKYEMKIIISPIGYYTDLYSEKDADHANYSHLTWDEINEMMQSGWVEFQNHTYNLHENKNGRMGSQKRKDESVSAYTSLLTDDLTKMQDKMKEHTGYTPNTFVYPFGAISKDAFPVLKSLGFQASLTCESKINYITRDPECLFGIGRYLRPAGKTSEQYFSKVLP